MFKTLSDPFVGHITMFRVISGRVRPDASMHNATQGTDERIGQLFTLARQGSRVAWQRSSPATSAPSPSWHMRIPATRSARSPTRCTLAPVDLPEPLLAYAIAPKTKGDEDKLATGLARLREEDPTLRVSRNEETHETVMHGMGEAHLEVMIERLKRKFGVEVTTGAGEDRVPRDDPGQGQGAGTPREAVGGPRPVRGLRYRTRAVAPR